MPIRSPRRAATRTPQQIVEQLRQLARYWVGIQRSEGVCDILLDELLTVRPDLREKL